MGKDGRIKPPLRAALVVAAQAKIDLVVDGRPVVAYWDFARQSTYDLASASLARTSGRATSLTVEMKTAGTLTGLCETVTK